MGMERTKNNLDQVYLGKVVFIIVNGFCLCIQRSSLAFAPVFYNLQTSDKCRLKNLL